MTLAEIVQRGWDAFAAGDLDALLADYTQDVLFVMPGQADTFNGIPEFRGALETAVLPAGFEVLNLRHIDNGEEVVTVCTWKSDRVEESQLAALFRFRGDKIFEERWFVDTEQWKGAI